MNTTRHLRVLATVAVVALGAALTVAAASPNPSAAAAPSLTSGSTIYLPSGKAVVLPKDFDKLTVAELAKLGVVPNMNNAGGASVIAQPTPVVQPQSATGCNKQVCIMVTGSGLHITKWQSTGASSPPVCTFATFWRNTTILATTPEICGPEHTTYLATKANMPMDFLNGTILCNSWVSIAGKPCETVHS
ncbi:hypothetical protein [Demequina sp.]|uniref:hypothetical protein n=1 Tax=Demequina sp. TaxID=2050685 RepID=UPI003D0AF361